MKVLGLKKNLQNSILLEEKVPFWEYFCSMSASSSHRTVISPFSLFLPHPFQKHHPVMYMLVRLPGEGKEPHLEVNRLWFRS